MKFLLPILLLIAFTSCDPESSPPPPESDCVLEAHITGDTLYIHYDHKDYPIGCFEIETSDRPTFDGPVLHGWGSPRHTWVNSGCGQPVSFSFDQKTTILWHPTWIRLDTPGCQDTIKVN